MLYFEGKCYSYDVLNVLGFIIVKAKTIDSFFKRKNVGDPKSSTPSPSTLNHDCSNENENRLEYQKEETEHEDHLSKFQRVETKQIDIRSLERDPRLRPQIWEFDVNQKNEIRRAYLKIGPYQLRLEKYPLSGSGKHPYRF